MGGRQPGRGGRGRGGADVLRSVRASGDASRRFDAGSVVFDLHVGTSDPPANLAALPPDRGPALATDETPFLLAAFNGGFKANAGPGGVEVQDSQ